MTGPADTYMPLFIGDYLGDTMHLSTLEHGAYLLLIFHYWRTGRALPDGDEALSRITKLSRSQWESMADVIRPFFRAETIDGESVLTHKRVASELEVAIGKYELRKSAALESHKARATKSGGPPFGKRKKRCNASATILPPNGGRGREDGPLKGGAASPANVKHENALALLRSQIGDGSKVWLLDADVLEDDDGCMVLTVPKNVQINHLKNKCWNMLDRVFGEGKWRVELTEQAAA